MRFAGERMKRIRIQKQVSDRDPKTGQSVNTWQDVDNDPNPWANVRDQRGNEIFQSDKKTAEKTRIFQVYMRSDVDETCTILEEDSGRRYDIENIHPIGARKLDLEATWTQGKYNE